MEIVDLRYLAGLFEGEGCFSVQQVGKRYFPRIQFKSTDLDIVERVRSLMLSGRIYTEKRSKDGYKDYYGTCLSGAEAINLMKIIIPYMGRRRTETICSIILKYETQPKAHGKRCSHSDSLTRKYISNGVYRNRCIECDRIAKDKRKGKERKHGSCN